MAEIKARKWINRRSIAALVVGIVLVVFPAAGILSTFRIQLLNEMLVLGLFALSYNLLLGYMGITSFGHAGLYGAGAYATIILLRHLEFPLIVAILVGPVVGAIIGFIIGWLTFRRLTGIHFALITLAFAQLVWAVVWKWTSVTGGENGLTWFGFTGWLSTVKGYYYFSLTIMVIGAYILYKLIRSPFGTTLRGIRENEERLKFIGIDTARYKIIAITISGFFSGLAGSMGALLARGAFPEFTYWTKTAQVLLATIIGGLYSFVGPVVGSSVLIFLQYIINKYTDRWLIVLGSVVVIIVLFFPGGIMGFLQRDMLRGMSPLALPSFRRRRTTTGGS